VNLDQKVRFKKRLDDLADEFGVVGKLPDVSGVEEDEASRLSGSPAHPSHNTAAPGAAAGQGLRGSGDIHAFGDSNLYLRRTREHLVLTTEHRAAPAIPPVALQLVDSDADCTHLEVSAALHDPPRRNLHDQVLALLPAGVVLTRARLRDTLGVKNERLGEALEALERAGRLQRTAAVSPRPDRSPKDRSTSPL
jgi:hypothetical protein